MDCFSENSAAEDVAHMLHHPHQRVEDGIGTAVVGRATGRNHVGEPGTYS